MLELRLTVRLPVGMAMEMGLVCPPPRLTGMLAKEVIPERLPGGLPMVVDPGLEDALGLLRLIGPPIPPLACFGVCVDVNTPLLFKLDARLGLDPELAGLRPPDPSLDFPERLAPGEDAEDVEFVLCFVLAAFPVN